MGASGRFAGFGGGLCRLMRADRAAGRAGSAKGLIHNGFDGARAAAALGAAAKAPIHLSGGPRPRRVAGGPDGAVGQDVAGTNDHWGGITNAMVQTETIDSRAQAHPAKPKTPIYTLSKVAFTPAAVAPAEPVPRSSPLTWSAKPVAPGVPRPGRSCMLGIR